MDTQVWIIDRPSRGVYDPDCLRYETRSLSALKDGEVLLRTIFLSMDPTLRNWLKLEPGSSPIPLKVGDVMVGQTISVVEESASPDFAPGDAVSGMSQWATYVIAAADGLQKARSDVPLETNMTIFSHIGLAAATGMYGIADVQANDTVVVSSAAGATGSLAAQIAKAEGARVIGIAGGPEKGRYLTEELGLDGSIDYKAENVEQAVRRLCPDGVSLFFDNVGGATLDAVLMNISNGARIAVCGQIATYNSTDPNDGQGVRNLMRLVYSTARMEGFLAGQMADKVPEYNERLKQLYLAGQLKVRSDIEVGFERAPEILNLLFTGGNDGKLIVEVSPPPAVAA